MVLSSLRKMMGGKKEASEPPMTPILETRSSPLPRGDISIPTIDDIPGMPPPPPDLPEPPRFTPGAAPEELAPIPPAIEERRHQRIEGFRRTRGDPMSAQPNWYQESVTPPAPEQQPAQQWQQAQPQAAWTPQPEPRMVQRSSQTIEQALGTVLDHLDRIERRLMDIDRRLSMIESVSRMR